jgi:hypothetical protein
VTKAARGGAAALDVERSLEPGASRSHIRFPFDIEAGAGGLEARFSYEPKLLADERRERELIAQGLRLYAGSLDPPGEATRRREPLSNLLTLSLDGPSGFRGCAHRHDPDQSITIGRDEATPGFVPGAVEPGRWTATVSVHCVVTDRCTFRLRVRAL